MLFDKGGRGVIEEVYLFGSDSPRLSFFESKARRAVERGDVIREGRVMHFDSLGGLITRREFIESERATRVFVLSDDSFFR
jgi:hypothetical protein